MKAVRNLVKSDTRFLYGAEGETSLVFTTEARDMAQQQRDFVSNETSQLEIGIGPSASLKIRIAPNTHDVLPDTGSVLYKKMRLELSPDEVMLSAVSSLKFQLLPSATVGNCCSNFHILLHQLFRAGCGATPTHHFHCMQDNADPALRMCCVWQKDCIEKKKLEMAALSPSYNNSIPAA